MPNFLDLAITLFLASRIHVLDFENIVCAWSALEDYGFGDVRFISLSVDPQVIKSVYYNAFNGCIEYCRKLIPSWSKSIDELVQSIQEHMIIDREIFTRFLFIKINNFQPRFADFIFNETLLTSSHFNAVYRALFCYREKSTRIPFILGSASIDEVEKFLRSDEVGRSFRVCSVSHPDVPVRNTAHEGSVATRVEHILHDYVHLIFNGCCPSNQKKFTFNLIDYLREATGVRWSRYIWDLVDSEHRLLEVISEVETLRCDDFSDEFFLNLFHFVKETQLWINFSPTKAKSINDFDWEIIEKIKEINDKRPDLSIMQKLFLVKKNSSYCHWVIKSPEYFDKPSSWLAQNYMESLRFVKVTSKMIQMHPILQEARKNLIFLASVFVNGNVNEYENCQIYKLDMKEFEGTL